MLTQTTALRMGTELRARVAEVADAPGPPSDLTLFAVGQAEVMARFDELERVTQRSVWNMSPVVVFDPESPALPLEHRSRARGLDLRMITSPRTLRFNPLLTSTALEVWIGPTSMRMLLVDERIAILEGPPTPDGETTAWMATAGEFLERSQALWAAAWSEARPALAEGEAPPLNARQCEVARLICLGATDAAIARSLQVSARTVARDVSTVLRVVDATSRAAAVLAMLGRGWQSRT